MEIYKLNFLQSYKNEYLFGLKMQTGLILRIMVIYYRVELLKIEIEWRLKIRIQGRDSSVRVVQGGDF